MVARASGTARCLNYRDVALPFACHGLAAHLALKILLLVAQAADGRIQLDGAQTCGPILLLRGPRPRNHFVAHCRESVQFKLPVDQFVVAGKVCRVRAGPQCARGLHC